MNQKERKMLEKILKDNVSIAYLATCDGDQPRVRPVSPVVEGLDIWITTFVNSRKMKQIKKNPKVCLGFCQPPDGEKRAIIIGKAEVIKDMKEKQRIWNMSWFDLKKYFPGGVKDKNYAVFKIKIDKIEWDNDWESGTKFYVP